LSLTAHVNASRRQVWVRSALLVGVVYFLIGRGFAAPASHVQMWRLAAWVFSGAVYAAHIAYEHFKLRNPPRITALHAALAVAIGAIGLAVAGMIHSLSVASTIRPAWLLALIVWPAVTAVPAFLVAWLAGAVLARLPRSADAE
jgi:hypothetical protein